MITTTRLQYSCNANTQKEMPFGFGNILFMVAGIIGVATKNGYSFGFNKWPNQDFFINPLPKIEKTLPVFNIPANFRGYDVGFQGFDIPDNKNIYGYFGSEKYFEHCKELVRHYFTMKDIANPYKDCVLMHYRNYNLPEFAKLDQKYYSEALKHFPDKRVVVVTDNIEVAKRAIRLDCEYINNSPIVDFYLLAHADYLVMANSTFSWWGAWLSQAKTVAPKRWYDGNWKDCPTKDLYCKDWILA